MGSITGSGISPGGGHGKPFHYSCLENPMDRGAWWATVHRVAQSWALLKQLSVLCCSVALSYPTLCDPLDCSTHQAPLSFTISWSLFKFMSIESLMLSNHLILCHPLLLLPSIFPSIRTFPVSQFFTLGGQSIGASASASVLPMNIQD